MDRVRSVPYVCLTSELPDVLSPQSFLQDVWRGRTSKCVKTRNLTHLGKEQPIPGVIMSQG